MPDLVPCPAPTARPVNEPATTTLSPGETAEVSITPSKRVTSVRFPTVAVSKAPYSIYELRVDNDEKYGPARIPPTDVDDLQTCFIPALKMTRELLVKITRTSSAGNDQTYHVQPVGWEESSNDGGT